LRLLDKVQELKIKDYFDEFDQDKFDKLEYSTIKIAVDPEKGRYVSAA
jgi:hypothetical protein